MLSVQTAGCAGMERLGVPTRTTLNTPPDDRGQYICRMHIDAARELLGVCNEPVIRDGGGNSRQQQNHHHIARDPATQQHHNHLQHHQHQRMASVSGAINSSASPLLATGNNSISNNNTSNSSNNIHHNNSNNFNNNLHSMTNNTTSSNSSIAKVGLEVNCMKYGNTGGGGSGSSGNTTSESSISSSGSQCSINSHSHDHHQHYQHQLQQQKTLCCPHHVPLPDSEWVPTDQRSAAHIRSSYQHSELTRSYIKPPPNKTVKDVPDRSTYNFYASTGQHNLNSGLHSLASTQSLAHSYSSSSSGSSTNSGTQSKSKPNVITKFFYRKSSPKSPNNVMTSSSSASSSSLSSATSSSSSATPSLYSALSSSSSSALSLLNSTSSANSTSSSIQSQGSLPHSTTHALKTTTCDYGPHMQQTPSLSVNHISVGLVPSTQLLTTIGVSHSSTTTFPHNNSANVLQTAGMEHQRIPTPPLSVTVPINSAYQQQLQQQQQQQHHVQQQKQQQQLLLDCLVGDCASVSSTLQTIKSSSCSPTLSASTRASENSTKDDMAIALQHMECQSGNITRNNSSSSMHSLTGGTAAAISATTTTTAATATITTPCNCQKSNCKQCTNDAAILTTSATTATFLS